MTKMTRKLAHCEDELHEAAFRQTGFKDFGDPTYREGLRAMLHHYDSNVKLTEYGWQATYENTVRMLVARLYTQRGWAQHPEVFGVRIHEPLVIIGFTRTGSTALHRLLSLDPQFQGLEYWLSQTPMIRPPRETWDDHAEYRTCISYLEARYARTPDLRKAHLYVASEVEECVEVLLHSFANWRQAAGPGAQPVRESYCRYADVLRLIGGRDAHKRWLLKCPHHMREIDTMLELFPDACFVQTHRDPLEAIPSLCSLIHMRNRVLEGDAARPDILGRRWCTVWREALDRVQAARHKYPAQFFDVDHRRFVVDPIGAVRSIYKYFGLTLSEQTEERMHVWVAARPLSKYGKHEYSLESWGVTRSEICDTFADYRTQHQFN